MPTIKLLPENLINQIAAGEVVERPASVVKELLENALDAGAQRLIVEVKEGGDNFLRVTDDGRGMDKEDAVMAFERHATSKISSSDDLFNIHTLGFRGEAIASIASVSYITLQTKQKGVLEGTLVQAEGGKLTNVKAIGAPEGTQIEVKNLFYNTPARKKYLKNPATEFGHILNTVTGLALAFPEVAFKLIHDDKVVFDLPATEDSLSRIRAVLGRNIADELVPVFYGHSKIQLKGYIGKPLIARASKSSQYLFVNDREVRSHVLSYAVKQSFHSLLPKEKYPVFLLFFQIDPLYVDVNVHPRKQEVRFSDEKEIFKIVLQACQKALETHVLSPHFKDEANLNYQQSRIHQLPLTLKDKSPTVVEFVTEQMRQPSGSSTAEQTVTEQPFNFSKDFVANDNAPKAPSAASSLNESLPEEEQQTFHERETMEEILPLAQISNSYILCHQPSARNADEALVIVDQHAAHERIRYTEILEQFESRQKSVQQLLVPEQIELSHQEVAILQENLEMLTSMGFEVEAFGGNTFSVYAVPTFIVNQDLHKTVLGLLDDFKNQATKGDFQSRKEKALTYMACRSAVKFGDPLSMEEQQSLIKKLQTMALPYTCPHGRPTMITLSFEELKRRFGRNYR